MPNLTAVVLGDTSLANHHGCQRVVENLHAGLMQNGVTITASESGKGWDQSESLRDAIRDADLLVINGEGSIHHNRPMGEEYLGAAEFADEHGTEAWLINTTWHANDASLAQRAKVFRRVYVRESYSQSELARHGVDAVVVPDLTFARGCFVSQVERSGFLTTDSTLQNVSRRLFQLTREYQECAFAPVVSTEWPARSGRVPRKLLSRRNWQRVVGQWVGSFGWCPVRYAALASAVAIPDDYLRRLASSQAVLSGRFHATCFAMITGTPLLAVGSNSPKIEALLADAGLNPLRMVDLKHFTNAELVGRLTEAEYTESEQQCLTRYVQSAAEKIARMFAAISHSQAVGVARAA